MQPQLDFLLGGARSGKSRLAQQRAESSHLQLIYLATAEAKDKEMQQRIEIHRHQRGIQWQLHEEPIYLARTLQAITNPNTCVVVDCLTLWLSNLMLQDDSNMSEQQQTELLLCLPQLEGHVIFVSNEVGQGIVPMGELSRRFVDQADWLHQNLARECHRVDFIIAGIEQNLKNHF